jgi:hypothetical protein
VVGGGGRAVGRREAVAVIGRLLYRVTWWRWLPFNLRMVALGLVMRRWPAETGRGRGKPRRSRRRRAF